MRGRDLDSNNHNYQNFMLLSGLNRGSFNRIRPTNHIRNPDVSHSFYPELLREWIWSRTCADSGVLKWSWIFTNRLSNSQELLLLWIADNRGFVVVEMRNSRTVSIGYQGCMLCWSLREYSVIIAFIYTPHAKLLEIHRVSNRSTGNSELRPRLWHWWCESKMHVSSEFMVQINQKRVAVWGGYD